MKVPVEMLAGRARRAGWLAIALTALCCLFVAAACGDDDDVEVPDEVEAPPTVAATTGGSVLDRLNANAETFRYEVGKHGGTITFATIEEPLTFNLAIATDGSSAALLGYVFEGLTQVSWLTDEVEPQLAESWENSPDGLSWTFRLRRDVRWHDGTPFTAQDVAFTFNEIIYNDDIPALDRSVFTFRFLNEAGEWQSERMTVETIDDYTVQFVLPVSFAPFLRSMSAPIFPKHILEQAVQEGVFNETWTLDSDPSEVIGTGPFTIESYTPGERVVVIRHDDYWLTDDDGQRLPYLDSIVLEIVEDRAEEKAAFLSGTSDAYPVQGSDFKELEALQEEGNFTIHRRGPSFSSTFLVLNQNSGAEPPIAPEKLRWFQNVDFRRAVSHAIDRDALIEDVYHGLGYEQWAFISPSAGVFHNPDVPQYGYNPDEANRILDGLGWMDQDGDGIREDDQGNTLEFEIATNDDNNARVAVLLRIEEWLGEVGVRVLARPKLFEDLIVQLDGTYDWEGIILGLGGSTEPHGSIVVWHSSEFLHLWNPSQPEPATAWEAEIDRLFVEGSQELDRERRVSIYREAQAIAAENLPLIYTALPERLEAVRNVFGNTTATLFGIWDIRYVYRLDQ